MERDAAGGARSLDSAACTAPAVTGCHDAKAARREFATVEYARSPVGEPHTLHGSQQVTTAAGMGIVALGVGAALFLRRPKRA